MYAFVSYGIYVGTAVFNMHIGDCPDHRKSFLGGDMLSGWLNNIRSIGIFLICAQMLIHFRPNGAYVKYLRLLVSIMILVQVMEPVGSLIGLLESGQLQEQVKEIEERLLQIREESYDIGQDAENIWSLLIDDVDMDSLQETVEE